ncbi:MAG: hypothetical protein ACXWJ4_06895, partial [Methyloceanibacter sp.]
ILLFAVSFGPWGAIDLSARSQKAELANILAAKGLLVDGRLTAPSANEEATSLLGSEAARARSIEWYLNQNHALVLLKPWFESYPTDPFASGKSPEAQMSELLVALGLRPDVPNGPSPFYFTHYSNVPQPVGLAGYSELIGPVVFEGGGPVPVPIPPHSVQVEGLGAVHLNVDANVITARTEHGAEIKFNLLDAAREIMRRGWPLTQDPRAHQRHGPRAGRHRPDRQFERRISGAKLQADAGSVLVRVGQVAINRPHIIPLPPARAR